MYFLLGEQVTSPYPPPNSQLEAIIRISESLAKIVLSPTVQEHHVTEAIRLFKTSTMDAVSASGAEGLSRGALNEDMQKIETELRRRLPIGWTTSYQALVKEFVTGQGYSQHALDRILYVLERREVIRYSNQKKVVHRWVPRMLNVLPRTFLTKPSSILQNWRIALLIFLDSEGRVCLYIVCTSTIILL